MPGLLPLLCTQFRDPPSAIRDHPGLNIDLRTAAVHDHRHMVLLTKDSLETRSAQTHRYKFECIFISTHRTHQLIELISDDRHIYIHQRESLPKDLLQLTILVPSSALSENLATWLSPELHQFGWGKVGSKTQGVHTHPSPHPHPLVSHFALIQH